MYNEGWRACVRGGIVCEGWNCVCEGVRFIVRGGEVCVSGNMSCVPI